jgi:hypothetical protein
MRNGRVAVLVAVAVVAVTVGVYVAQIARNRPRGSAPGATSTPGVGRNETPGDGAALARICDGGAGFSGAPPYRGAGPHPTTVILGSDVMWLRPAPDRAASPGPASVTTVQLVACLKLGGPGSPTPLTTCRYRDGVSATLFRGLHHLDIHTVDSGRLIDTVTVDGSGEPNCPNAIAVTEGTTSTSQITRPGDAQYAAALQRWVDGPAIR